MKTIYIFTFLFVFIWSSSSYAIDNDPYDSYGAGDVLFTIGGGVVGTGVDVLEGCLAVDTAMHFPNLSPKVGGKGGAVSVAVSVATNGWDAAQEWKMRQQAIEAGDFADADAHQWEIGEDVAKIAWSIATFALSGAATGAISGAIGGTIAGPVGTAIGGIAGAIVGGVTGIALGLAGDWIIENSSGWLRNWLENFSGKNENNNSVPSDKGSSGSSGGAPELKPHKVY